MQQHQLFQQSPIALNAKLLWVVCILSAENASYKILEKHAILPVEQGSKMAAIYAKLEAANSNYYKCLCFLTCQLNANQIVYIPLNNCQLSCIYLQNEQKGLSLLVLMNEKQ
uniref:Uncharacterized protein n=1 Tax=Rhizophora mucronata TaxID=61149 RepID=A0A2P2LJ02_RHIMU